MGLLTINSKVADAEAAGRDTTAAFVKEYNQFRNELAAPYLTDSLVAKQLLDEAYAHHKEDIKVSHIMVQNSKIPLTEKLKLKPLSIRFALQLLPARLTGMT